MVLIIQEPRAHQPEGQEIVPFEDLVDFGDGEKNVAFLIKKTYEKKAHRGKANLIQARMVQRVAQRVAVDVGRAAALRRLEHNAEAVCEGVDGVIDELLEVGRHRVGQVDLAHVLALVVLEVELLHLALRAHRVHLDQQREVGVEVVAVELKVGGREEARGGARAVLAVEDGARLGARDARRADALKLVARDRAGEVRRLRLRLDDFVDPTLRARALAAPDRHRRRERARRREVELLEAEVGEQRAKVWVAVGLHAGVGAPRGGEGGLAGEGVAFGFDVAEPTLEHERARRVGQRRRRRDRRVAALLLVGDADARERERAAARRVRAARRRRHRDEIAVLEGRRARRGRRRRLDVQAELPACRRRERRLVAQREDLRRPRGEQRRAHRRPRRRVRNDRPRRRVWDARTRRRIWDGRARRRLRDGRPRRRLRDLEGHIGLQAFEHRSGARGSRCLLRLASKLATLLRRVGCVRERFARPHRVACAHRSDHRGSRSNCATIVVFECRQLGRELSLR